jgi:uncharacterized protein
MENELVKWEQIFVDYIIDHELDDASHDLGHFRRVYYTAKNIACDETVPVDLLIILAAAYFHDIVSFPKDHPDSSKSSYFASIKAQQILQELNFPQEKITPVCHAIKTHSFSAGLQPETIEAKIVQDADRMEALGALGIMRTFYVSGRMGREPFDPNDLYAEKRPLNDKMFGLDHFYLKLFKLPDLLQTSGGRRVASERVQFLQHFIEELDSNVKNKGGGGLEVIQACYDAGRHGLKLFDLTDPLSYKRPLDMVTFALDRLVAIQNRFAFVDQSFSISGRN